MEEIKNESLKTFIKKIINKTKSKRKAKGVTQQEFSECKNISWSSVKKIESFKCYDLKIIDKYIK